MVGLHPRFVAGTTGWIGVLFLFIGISTGGLLICVGAVLMLIGSWKMWWVPPFPTMDVVLTDRALTRSIALRALRAGGVFFAGLTFAVLQPWFATLGVPPWLTGSPLP